MFTKPNSKPDFYSLEKELLQYWKNNNILEKSIDQRPNEMSRTFYDGPITANGEPHTGHMLTFAMKDIIPRYWTMKGFRVVRSLGWDCQGIPVEYEVEKKLGFKEKKDIEKFGIAKFNDLCRESVMKYRQNIIELEEMMGRLTNKEEEYATMDKKYIESIWWSLKELFTKGLLYEGFKVVPYSTRAGTTLSNAEVALGGYKPFTDPAITVEFQLKNDLKSFVLAWTTTPWTIPGNLGLAIGKDIKYVQVKLKKIESVPEDNELNEKIYIVAEEVVENIFREKEYEVVGRLTSDDLVGLEYVPPFDFYKARDKAHKIYLGDHVTSESGTGIVHLAPYGEEDNEMFQKIGIKSFDYLDDQGDFTDEIPPYSGLNYRDANLKIIEDLKSSNRLFRVEEYVHDMPMCWRTNTPLIYKPITSWYVAMSNLRTNLVENNNKINWVPEHMKDGRFGNWLSEIKDWGISRLRYWGTPLPVWKSESGKIMFVGSFEELKTLSGIELSDPHRPYVDDITFKLDGETYTRIPDVIDVWYDSGAMPFARFHYPFENKDKFEKKFPAQYIAESVDQTRGWFYTLHAISTALFNSEAFQNVIVSGFTLDDHGVKQSKSKKNYTDPKPTVEKYGADTIRLNFYNSPISAGEDSTISEATLRSHAQEFMLPLWNIFSYLTTYANIHNWTPTADLAYNTRHNFEDTHPWDHIPFDDIENELDAWILLRLQQTILNVTTSLDSYYIPRATRSIKDLLDDISKWYIRRSRDRFFEGNSDALNTLYYVFIETMKLLAPFAPFVTEHIYKELVVSQFKDCLESIHLTNYPEADLRFIKEYSSLENEMNFVRKITELGHNLRTESGLKVRQPLSKLLIVNLNQENPTIASWMEEMLRGELNVLDVAEALSLEEGEKLKVLEDTSLNIKVGLDIFINDELSKLGSLREITRSIQSLRKTLGLEMGELADINVFVDENTQVDSLVNILLTEKENILKTVNAKSLEIIKNKTEMMKECKIGDSIVWIEVSKTK